MLDESIGDDRVAFIDDSATNERRMRRLATLRKSAAKRRKQVDAVSVEVPKGFGVIIKEFTAVVKEFAEKNKIITPEDLNDVCAHLNYFIFEKRDRSDNPSI